MERIDLNREIIGGGEKLRLRLQWKRDHFAQHLGITIASLLEISNEGSILVFIIN